MSEMMSSLPYYYDRPKWHYNRPSLLEEAINLCKYIHKKHIFMGKLGQTSKKQIFAIKSVCQSILHYVDIPTLQYGIWDTSKRIIKPFDLRLLRKISGLSYYYFYFSIKRLKLAGYLTVKRIYQKLLTGYVEKGTPEYKKAFKAFPAMRSLSLSFFIDLGISRDKLQLSQRSFSSKREDRIIKERTKQDYINKPTSYKLFIPTIGKKSKQGATYISRIKDILKNIKNHASDP